ncbi:hypothetical protein NQ318_014152 [Aromia moschata]|uniref:Uncharacterized protein n=1 Tax=Aromia moschata TaxID=1265417 RepID=A0AAV8X8W7_9CUCU|nr:hypothetical protein NQ318_014152 [Aromia moschata]
MTLDERKCLKAGHVSKRCRSRLKCIVCGYSHVPLMCLGLAEKKTAQSEGEFERTGKCQKDRRAKSNRPIRHEEVRALLDTGSQPQHFERLLYRHLFRPKRAEKLNRAGTECIIAMTSQFPMIRLKFVTGYQYFMDLGYKN